MLTVIPAVQAVMADLVERDIECGFQVAATSMDSRVWTPGLASPTPAPSDTSTETLFVCFRYGKGVVATAIHLFAERGRIDYDTHVADYWPAVGANGKGQITVRQLLKDTAGIPQLLLGCTVEELFNWDRTCDGIAALASMRQPGSRTG